MTIMTRRQLRIAPRGQQARGDARLSDFARRDTSEREVDQVVVEHGTLPNDELYFALKPLIAAIAARSITTR